MRKRAAVLLFIFLSAYPVLSQDLDVETAAPNPEPEGQVRPGEFWLGIGAETAMYGPTGFIFGGSFSFGYGRGTSVGLKAVYFYNHAESLDVLELNFLLRFYFQGFTYSSGPYIQILGGAAIFFRRENGITIPAQWGTVSAGAAFGWRFHLGKLFFFEPYIRAGYPYIAGGGLTAGVRL
jgi:hypothetical protein